MKIIRWWGILAFVVITLLLTLAWYLLAPRIIASTIETAGSEALGAKVEVGNVELTLAPLSVGINQFSAADPDAPMKNLFEAEQIKMSIDAGDLLWRKIVIDELVFTGAKTQTARTESGALEGGRSSKKAAEKLVDLVLPEVGDIDVNEMVNNADLVTLKRIEAFKNNQARMNEEWKTALDKKAFNERTDKLKMEFDRLSKRAKENKLNLIKDRKAWKKLKTEIDAERKNISTLSAKLKSDKAQLAKELKAIKQGPKDDLDAIMNNVGLGNGVDGLVDKYLGPQYTPWVKRAIEMSQSMGSGKKEEATEKQGVVAVGDRVYFKDKKIFPDVLIKKVKLNGSNDGWELSGDGLNLGYLPWLTGKPAKLDILLDGKGKANFGLTSDWKSQNEMLTNLDSQINSWPLEAMTLMATKQGDWSINSGNLSANIKGSLTLEKIDLSANFKVSSPKISFPESLDGWQKGLAQSINTQSAISFKLTASGSVTSPKIKLDSSLENLFQDALGAELKQKAQSLKSDVESKLKEKIGDLSSLENYTEQFKSWQDALGEKDQLLGDIKNSLKL